MEKVQVEFINTCSCCASYEQDICKAAEPYGEKVEVKIYHAGKDFDYLKKYGMISKGTMIIDGQKKFDSLNKDVIVKAIQDAVEQKAEK